ncbi:hypothetical protein AB0I16_33335 [Streptomyces sp. NPDC050703]|uniref:hypothetical protein n=1 Tax=Streptomyces sp. NPDC050703 TaxID=3157218 RepID=UPI00343D2908
MVYVVLCGLPGHWGTSHVWRSFRVACRNADVEPEFADVTTGDPRADDVEVVPTIRVYAEDDPYGEPLAEHRGATTGEEIRALIERGKALV